ncbi:MAG TPA: PD-(D/E)XK nuclease family protein, partial [bacterium]|nr:PD-(D/E)XK nuclease family protein [bacterium]
NGLRKGREEFFLDRSKKNSSLTFSAQLKEKLPRQAMERYLFYLAVTRASEKLFLTYPRLDLEGKESLPSYYIDEVLAHGRPMATFRKQSLGRPYPELREAVNERELEMAVMGELWAPEKDLEKRPLVLYLTNEILKRPGPREKFKRAFYEVKDELTDPAIAALDVFKPFETSATTLEGYARCPFKYYARKVLKLENPEEDMNVTRRGSILHRALQRCFEKWNGKYPSLDRALQEAGGELETAFLEYPLVTEKKYQLDLEREGLRDMLFAFLGEELERLKSSPLQPRYFELGFGKEGSPYPVFEIETPEGTIKLRGEIDRVDTDATGQVGAIIDYKRTAAAAKFDKKDFEMGISLQLPLYLLALEKFLKLKPAGAELYAIRERRKSGFYHAGFTEFFPGLSPKKIILSEAEFRNFLEKCVDFVRQFASAMVRMEIPVKPRSANECDFCSYDPVCRIQKWRVPLIIEEIKESLKCHPEQSEGSHEILRASPSE